MRIDLELKLVFSPPPPLSLIPPPRLNWHVMQINTGKESFSLQNCEEHALNEYNKCVESANCYI